MKYIERFKYGRKIRKALEGDNSNNWATFTTNGNRRTYTPVNGNGEDWRTRKLFGHNLLNMDEYLQYVKEGGSDTDDISKVLKWKQAYDQREATPVIDDNEDSNNTENQTQSVSIVQDNLRTPSTTPQNKPIAVTPKKSIDWKEYNLKGLQSVFAKDTIIGGNSLDFWAHPLNFAILQQYLKDAYYDIGKYGTDGHFGSDTEQALRMAIRNKGFKKDGTINPGIDINGYRFYTLDNLIPLGFGYDYNIIFTDGIPYRISSDGRLYRVKEYTAIYNGKPTLGYTWTLPDGLQVFLPKESNKVMKLHSKKHTQLKDGMFLNSKGRIYERKNNAWILRTDLNIKQIDPKLIWNG